MHTSSSCLSVYYVYLESLSINWFWTLLDNIEQRNEGRAQNNNLIFQISEKLLVIFEKSLFFLWEIADQSFSEGQLKTPGFTSPFKSWVLREKICGLDEFQTKFLIERTFSSNFFKKNGLLPYSNKPNIKNIENHPVILRRNLDRHSACLVL